MGARRVDHADDFVRMEVAAGLRRSELRVIPVLIQGARMPAPTSLPEELRDLARRNAIELSDTRWRDDVARLIASLESTMATGARTAPAGTPASETLSEVLRKVRIPAGVTVPPWSKWGAGAAVALLLAWGTFGALRSDTREAGSGAAAGNTDLSTVVPSGEMPRVPDHLGRAAHAVTSTARRWRRDALLTEIRTQLGDSGVAADEYRVDYQFRSPSDGAGLTVMTTASGKVAYKKEPPAPQTATRAVPDSFLDLPAALSAARAAGMFGQLQLARLSVSAAGMRAGKATWTLRPVESDRSGPYYIDAVTGKAVKVPTRPKRGGLIKAVEGIFK